MAIERYLIDATPRIEGAPTVNFSGRWVNDLDSDMRLTVLGSNLSGLYRTKVGSPSDTEEFELTGFVADDLIVFCVNFGGHQSLTSWAGQHTRDHNGNEVINTLWHLARNVPDEEEPENIWAAILAGANSFRRA